jgi:hypothetical protein
LGNDEQTYLTTQIALRIRKNNVVSFSKGFCWENGRPNVHAQEINGVSDYLSPSCTLNVGNCRYVHYCNRNTFDEILFSLIVTTLDSFKRHRKLIEYNKYGGKEKKRVIEEGRGKSK